MEASHIVSFQGEFDSTRKRYIQLKLGDIQLIEDDTPFIVDLTGVTFLDFTFIHCLIHICESAPGRTIYIISPPHITRLLEIVQNSARFRLFDTLLAAREYFLVQREESAPLWQQRLRLG